MAILPMIFRGNEKLNYFRYSVQSTRSYPTIENKEKFLERKHLFLEKFLMLLKDEQSEFTDAITRGTSGKGAVETRFKIMNELIREVLNEN